MGILMIVLLIVAVVFMLIQAEWTYIKADKTKKQMNDRVQKGE